MKMHKRNQFTRFGVGLILDQTKEGDEGDDDDDDEPRDGDEGSDN